MFEDGDKEPMQSKNQYSLSGNGMSLGQLQPTSSVCHSIYLPQYPSIVSSLARTSAAAGGVPGVDEVSLDVTSRYCIGTKLTYLA